MTDRQIEKLGELFLDIGKLVVGSLVLGFFQSGLPSLLVLAYSLVGLTVAIVLFTMELLLLKEVK